MPPGEMTSMNKQSLAALGSYRSCLLVLGLTALLTPCSARAEVRLLVAVGVDSGLPGDVPLRYAENDASRFAAALDELGGVSRSTLLLGANASGLPATMAQLQRDVVAAHSHGERVLFVLYYSGHADHDFLHIDGTRLSWDKLRGMVRDVGADVALSFIDACGSGGAALAKGATAGEPFAVERENVKTTGVVWLTSSRGEEASFESDELGGSFFTHYLVSAMRGSGDLDEDGRVTLSETYQFAYQQTVGETSLRLRSVQHPTYGFELAGEGDVVLTELRRSAASLVVPRELEGVYFLSRRYGPRRNTIEIAKKPGTIVRVGVSAGAYLLYRREADRIWLASYDVHDGGEVVVDASDFKSRRYENVVGKGGAVELSDWQVFVGGGAAAPVVSGARFAPLVQLGLLSQQGWFGFGVTGTYSQFGFAALDTHVDDRTVELTANADLLWESAIGMASLGAGVAGLWLSQSPHQGARVDALTPGVVAHLALEQRLAGDIALRADAALAAWFMRLDDSHSVSLRLSPRATLGVAMHLQ